MSELLQIEGLTKTFSVPAGLFSSRPVSAVADVSLAMGRGEILGLVGESGSGKSTLARCVLGLTRPTAGRILFDGEDVTRLRPSALREYRRRVQPVFQDPYASLDPRWTIGRTIRESLDAFGIGSNRDRDARVIDLLERVGLRREHADRRPASLSGGQRQRVGIAAALASRPELIVADEPVSALDVSVQAQILNLLASLRADLGVSVLFITHDLSVVEHLCQRTAVMYLGRLTEVAPTETFFAAPQHHYSVALRDAIPRPDPAHRLEHVPLRGEIPSPLSPPSGCRFHPRCPAALPVCSSDDPPLQPQAPHHLVACWNPVRATAPTTQLPVRPAP
ncbi:ABC transporter ATP-binding protein [Angustibacter sp. Root456]|uniref:ABC transporter ATP-binding protein n=1 Tax=Angustibacter sp. Root456 TaxID=1736539 RepID=UPI0007021D63|nr:ABC transporter ATP-binding protein [Angustibacter sp. Root456]KQX66116.1 hypothetical protein ASD06_06925 [Angustibacter sp. Root456]